MIEGLLTRELTGSDRASIIAAMSAWTPAVDFARLLPQEMFQAGSGISKLAVGPDDYVAGFVLSMVSRHDPRCGYVHMVWVSPEFRGRGLATRLYQEVFAGLRTLGCDRVEAATASRNAHAVAFHRKLGFEICPPQLLVDELGELRQAVLMQRDLREPGRVGRARFPLLWPASRQDHPRQR